MKPMLRFRPASHTLAAGIFLLPLAIAAQTVTSPQEADWRRANEAVGAFKRGHADVLKWEQANTTPTPKVTVPTGRAISTLEEAVRMAWKLRTKLAHPLAQLGSQNQQLIAQGRWTELDPYLQRQVRDIGEVLEVAVNGRKAWIDAVAAQQVLKYRQDMLEAAQAAYELGQRMVTVGNWSKLQLAPVHLNASNARMNLRRAQQAALQAQAKLVKTMELTGLEDGFVLPDQLPEIPSQPMAAHELQQRADAIQSQLPYAESLHNRALSKTAMNVYWAAHALAQDSQGDILKISEFMTEETVLHYNGMLKSVWDLLDVVRNQSQATVDAIGAQRDFWFAEADLQWVLQGGKPDSFVNLSGAGGDAPAPAAH